MNSHGLPASTTATVLITIIDVNDIKPEFYVCGALRDELPCKKETHFTGEVVEHSLGLIPINMTVKDNDKVRKKEDIHQLKDEVIL